MFALYFTASAGGRVFITAVDDRQSALSMARLLSRQDPREVVVVENDAAGETAMVGTYSRGTRREAERERARPKDNDQAPLLN